MIYRLWRTDYTVFTQNEIDELYKEYPNLSGFKITQTKKENDTNYLNIELETLEDLNNLAKSTCKELVVLTIDNIPTIEIYDTYRE